MVAGLPAAAEGSAANLAGVVPVRAGRPGLLEAPALMFVAYTGYGRIATLGEEVREPEQDDPPGDRQSRWSSRWPLYVCVAAVAVTAAGLAGVAEIEADRAAPLEDGGHDSSVCPESGPIVALGR